MKVEEDRRWNLKVVGAQGRRKELVGVVNWIA